jgi:hypothetical protein
MAQVNFSNKLQSVVRSMNLPNTCTNAAFALRLHYNKYLKEYEAVKHFGQSLESIKNHVPKKRKYKSKNDESEDIDEEEEEEEEELEEEEEEEEEVEEINEEKIEPPKKIKSIVRFKLKKIDFEKLEFESLKKYRKMYNIKTVTNNSSKDDLINAITEHFNFQKVWPNDEEIINTFIKQLN